MTYWRLFGKHEYNSANREPIKTLVLLALLAVEIFFWWWVRHNNAQFLQLFS